MICHTMHFMKSHNVLPCLSNYNLQGQISFPCVGILYIPSISVIKHDKLNFSHFI